jgi:hypothetical protein
MLFNPPSLERLILEERPRIQIEAGNPVATKRSEYFTKSLKFLLKINVKGRIIIGAKKTGIIEKQYALAKRIRIEFDQLRFFSFVSSLMYKKITITIAEIA